MTRDVARYPAQFALPAPVLNAAVVLVALCGVLFLGAGCASHQPQPSAMEEPSSIERPARPLSEEESLADRIGEVGVVLLVVGIAVGGILVPILLL